MQKTSDIIWQDAQHQVLFETLDSLRESAELTGVLLKLKDYVEHHFSLEERYMEVLEYPASETHIASHNYFRIQLGKLLETGDEPDEVFREIIITFLTEWLTRHVFVVDRKLEAFILQSYAK